MLAALGYDSYGNNSHLLAPSDAAALEEGDYTRADGNTICEHCQAPYRTHPQVQGALWLRRICPNELVKL